MDTKQFKTKNISASIEKFARANELSISKLSFGVNHVDTYIKTVSDDDYVLYNEDIRGFYTDRDKMINEHVSLRQIYTITIKEAPKSILNLKYSIDFSDDTHPFIILEPQSKIPYKEYQPKEIYSMLLRELTNIKVKNKILIKIFDEDMKKKLKAFVKHLYKDKFIKKIKIPLFCGMTPEMGRSSKLILYFLKKQSNQQLIEVDSGELLAEYIKPLFGKKGFNAYGDITDSLDVLKKKDIESTIDTNSIEIVEDDERKLYKSKLKGYVHLDKKSFFVDTKIMMNKLSRVQDTVVRDESNNIQVIVSQNDTSMDSLGEGVELISETIHITGHIGAKSILKAVTLEIDGATHQDSAQEAKFATINRHKGKLRCHSANITLLEGGEVHATNVTIKSSLGGTIYAENVTIDSVKNNLKVYASNSITIRHVSGENNLFKINYKDIPTLVSRCKYIQRDLDDLRYKLEGAQKHTASQVPILRAQINALKAALSKISNSAKEATVTIKDPFRGLNTITFVLDNNEELIYKTDEMAYAPFYLVESQNYITLHPTNKRIAIKS